MKLNLIHCYRSMNYMCKVMEEKYGIPWLEFNFFGPTKIRESLRSYRRALRRYIKEKVEAGHRQVRPDHAGGYRRVPAAPGREEGDAVVGGLRPRHTVDAYEDLGMECVGSGYEFAHGDDYDRTSPEMPEPRSSTMIHRSMSSKSSSTPSSPT